LLKAGQISFFDGCLSLLALVALQKHNRFAYFKAPLMLKQKDSSHF